MSETCATCRFWQAPGYCRRYPEFIARAAPGWCGEHQSREVEPKARAPGWYWVLFDFENSKWSPMRWRDGGFDDGKYTWLEEQLAQVGPRLEPPA